MASADLINIITYLVVILRWSTFVYGQNIIKEHTSVSDLSSKVNDLKPDGSQYGVGGFDYYGGPFPTPAPALNYRHAIAPTPYVAKPYYPTALAAGYYPQGFAVPGKPAAPYNGYGYSAVGYPAAFGLASGVGVSYPGVLGYSGGGYDHNYPHHSTLSPHGYNGVHYGTGYLG